MNKSHDPGTLASLTPQYPWAPNSHQPQPSRQDSPSAVDTGTLLLSAHYRSSFCQTNTWTRHSRTFRVHIMLTPDNLLGTPWMEHSRNLLSMPTLAPASLPGLPLHGAHWEPLAHISASVPASPPAFPLREITLEHLACTNFSFSHPARAHYVWRAPGCPHLPPHPAPTSGLTILLGCSLCGES